MNSIKDKMKVNKEKGIIKGLSHITFICQDIYKAADMFKYLFNAEEIYSSGEQTFSTSKEIFLSLSGMWIAIMEGKPIERTYNHVAFQVDETLLDGIKVKINKLGLTILPGRTRKPAEGESIYFYDYDNHLFELHAGDLESRLDFYNKTAK